MSSLLMPSQKAARRQRWWEHCSSALLGCSPQSQLSSGQPDSREVACEPPSDQVPLSLPGCELWEGCRLCCQQHEPFALAAQSRALSSAVGKEDLISSAEMGTLG